MRPTSTLDHLFQKRMLEAFGLVGTVRALLYISKTFNQPINPAELQEALDRYEAAETAITEFSKQTALATQKEIA